jgi:hypothetical protein
MKAYSVQQKVFIVNEYYRSRNYVLRAQRNFCIGSQVYLNIFQNVFVLFLMGYGVYTVKAWFQQDDMRPHTAGNVDFFKETFGNRVLSNGFLHVDSGGFEWPLFSPDLNPYDIFPVDISHH